VSSTLPTLEAILAAAGVPFEGLPSTEREHQTFREEECYTGR
jgi:hypothetical protein